jgi:hypothetical protein
VPDAFPNGAIMPTKLAGPDAGFKSPETVVSPEVSMVKAADPPSSCKTSVFPESGLIILFAIYITS